MKKLQTMSTFLGGVLIGGILLGSLSMATAEDTALKANTNTDTISESAPFKSFGKFREMGMGKMRGMVGIKGHGKMVFSEESIDKLIADKLITQQKADQIEAFIEKQAKERDELRDKLRNMTQEERQKYWEENKNNFAHKGDLFSQLIENKILTEKQADTIQTKLRDEVQAQHKKELTKAMQGLVDNKTITKAQRDKILAQFDATMKEREVLFEKTKGMTHEERHQYMQENKANLTNPIYALVKEGTITEDQADKLREASPHKGFKGHRGVFKGSKGMFKESGNMMFKGQTEVNEQIQTQ